MPDPTAKARRASAIDRMASLAAVPNAEAEPEPEAPAAEPKPSRPARKAAPAKAMLAETRPGPDYPARMSHATTHEQLDALEDLSRSLRRDRPDLGAVPVTALLRAAAAICLDDERLRARMVREARTTWAARKR
jgi:hypothetical protein